MPSFDSSLFPLVELREIRVFLTVADELHFARAAERLDINPSRASQVINAIEAKIGGSLFERTSRRVQLTPLGELLREAVEGPYAMLRDGLIETRETADGVAGTLRIGLYVRGLGGARLVEIVRGFKARHPACNVEFVDVGLVRNSLDWLRAGGVDLLVMRLPLSEPDIAIGPVLESELRVVLVGESHPLAGRASIVYEDLAPYRVTDAAGLPREMMDAFIPPRTPSGVVLARYVFATVGEAMMQVAVEDVVHVTVATVADDLERPGIVAVPVTDLPASETALIWLKRNRSKKIQAFIKVAEDIIASPARPSSSTP